MSSGADASAELLFAQLVSHRLRSLSEQLPMEADFFNALDPRYYDDAGPFDFQYASSHEKRLATLESIVAVMAVDVKTILARLPVAQSQCDERGIAPEFVVRKDSAPVCSTIRKVRRSRESSQSSTEQSPVASNISTPLQFQFVCPLCLKPQQTPKSHCEHLKNTVDEGVHVCRFVQEHTRHSLILELFGNGLVFVQWYTSFLRSGMGSKFTERDIQDYKQLQKLLEGVLSGQVQLSFE
jgi:hypothetical protein